MDNPFKTPTANLERPLLALPKPPAVVLATRLLWVVIGLSLVSFIPGVRTDFWDEAAESSVAVMVGITVLMFVLYSLLIVFIGKGANWARWLMFAFTLLSWISMVTDISSLVAQGGAVIIVELAITLAEGYAMKLLFFGEGAQWFNES